MADNADDKSVASFKAENKSEAAKWTDHIRACTGVCHYLYFCTSKASKPSTLALMWSVHFGLHSAQCSNERRLNLSA